MPLTYQFMPETKAEIGPGESDPLEVANQILKYCYEPKDKTINEAKFYEALNGIRLKSDSDKEIPEIERQNALAVLKEKLTDLFGYNPDLSAILNQKNIIENWFKSKTYLLRLVTEIQKHPFIKKQFTSVQAMNLFEFVFANKNELTENIRIILDAVAKNAYPDNAEGVFLLMKQAQIELERGNLTPEIFNNIYEKCVDAVIQIIKNSRPEEQVEYIKAYLQALPLAGKPILIGKLIEIPDFSKHLEVILPFIKLVAEDIRAHVSKIPKPEALKLVGQFRAEFNYLVDEVTLEISDERFKNLKNFKEGLMKELTALSKSIEGSPVVDMKPSPIHQVKQTVSDEAAAQKQGTQQPAGTPPKITP